MDKEIVVRLHSSFEAMVQKFPQTGTEFWCARDLQMLLGYAQWRSFAAVIDKAITACEKAGYDPKDHFAHISKMVDLGSGAKREIEDIALTRYACYLIAQNGDPAKDQIAFAQTYFAVQTRRQEIVEKRLADTERVSARKKLTRSEKELSGIIFDRIGDNESFGRIRSKGDKALFGGRTTQDMKDKLRAPKKPPARRFSSNNHHQGQRLCQRNHQLQYRAKCLANGTWNYRRACQKQPGNPQAPGGPRHRPRGPAAGRGREKDRKQPAIRPEETAQMGEKAGRTKRR